VKEKKVSLARFAEATWLTEEKKGYRSQESGIRSQETRVRNWKPDI
jgi:hypothetical protein